MVVFLYLYPIPIDRPIVLLISALDESLVLERNMVNLMIALVINVADDHIGCLEDPHLHGMSMIENSVKSVKF